MRVPLEVKLQGRWKLVVGTRRCWWALVWRSQWALVRCSWWARYWCSCTELDVAGGLGLWLAGSPEIGAVEVLGLCVVGKLGPAVVRVLGVVSLEAGIALGGGFVEPMRLGLAVVVVRIVSRAAYLVDWALS